MALLPGGLGSKFGIGPFVTPRLEADAPLQFLGTGASPQDATVSRQERVVYDTTSTPVFVAPAATPLALAEVAATIVRRAVVRSLAVFAATSAMAEPVFVPAQLPTATITAPDVTPRARRIDLPDGYAEPVFIPTVAPSSISSTLASTHSSPVIVKSRVVYDQGAARPVLPPTPVAVLPPPDAPQSGFARSRIKRTPLSAFVFAYPVDDLAADYTDPVVRAIRPKPKRLPDGAIHPPFLPAPSPIPPSIDSLLAGAYSAPTVVLSRVVYDPTSTPVFKPVVATVTPAAFAYQNVEAVWKRQRKVLPDGAAIPLVPPVAVTPSIFGHQPVEPVWRVLKKALPEGFTSPVYPPAAPPTPIPLGSVCSSPTVIFNRVIYDQTAAPVFKAIPPAVTPSYLFETIAPPWKAKPNSKAIGANLQGIVRPDKPPPPPAATPTALYDNIGGLRRQLPNGKAIGINLQGFAWSPQDPRNLTGTIPPVVPPQVIQPYPIGGDYWHRVHKKKAGKSDKRCRWVTIDGVLTWICDRLTQERSAEARLQALDLVWDAEGIVGPLLEAVRLEEATNASEAKRAAAALLLQAIHEAVIEDEDDDLLLLD